MGNWTENSYARILVDMHITEEDRSFMRKFDPLEYVRLIKRAGVDTAMVYASCHNGNCYYPTKTGHMHKNLDGRDIFGETVSLLRQEGVGVIGYYSIVYHNHTAKTHPRWRITDVRGGQRDGRYWLCCPNNSEYRRYVKAQLSEIIEYDIDGVFIDMTFWPGICVCEHCRDRYRVETGAEFPEIIDWSDGGWVKFQRARERWITECGGEFSAHIKRRKPDLTVVHNLGALLVGWYLAQNSAMSDISDYASGDFYGGIVQQRLGTKVFSALTETMPYEFMTSRCVTLRDHTSMKSEAEMVCSAGTTLANGGAYFFIDAINPDGTLYESTYDRLQKVSSNLKPFKEKIQSLRPRIIADTGLYFSTAALINDRYNQKSITALPTSPSNMNIGSSIRTVNELLGTAVILNRAHIPYRVITEQTDDLDGLKALIVNNAAYLTAEEADRIREFVERGGSLFVTGMTSLYDQNGNSGGDFTLGDVFGVSYTGRMSMRVNYLVDKASGRCVSCDHPAPVVTAAAAEILAHVSQPWFSPDDIDRFASIHCDPPSPATKFAALTINRYGKGRCIYLYSSLLAMQQDAQQVFGMDLLKKYLPGETIIDTNAPACVEITLLKSSCGDSLLVSFVNYQEILPNVPIHDVTAGITLPNGISPKACVRVGAESEINYAMLGGRLQITIPYLETIAMIEIKT